MLASNDMSLGVLFKAAFLFNFCMFTSFCFLLLWLDHFSVCGRVISSNPGDQAVFKIQWFNETITTKIVQMEKKTFSIYEKVGGI